MTVLREYLRRLWGAFRRNPADHDLERELRFHLEQAEEELRGKGHAPAEAARLARVRLGGFPQTMEALRDQRGLPWLDDLRTDVRVGVRGLARRPGFTAAAVLTLAIGIGATAGVATVTNALLFQPLPVPDPDELVVVAQLRRAHRGLPARPVLSRVPRLPGAQRRLRRSGRAQPGATAAVDRRSRGGAGPGRVRQRQLLRGPAGGRRAWPQVSPGRRAPARGRPVHRVDASCVADAVRRRSGHPGAGRAPRPANMAVIGIMPEAFTGASGVAPGELYALATEGALVEPGWTELLTNRLPERFVLTGRLRAGVTVGEAAAQLDVLADALAAEHPDASRDSELYVVAERHARPEPGASRYARPLMSVVMGLATLVLLVAIANVGTLLVGRGVARRQEMALRAGLGATRRRLVRQLVTESVLLASMGGAGGGLFAIWAVDFVMATQTVIDTSVDWRVFGFTAATVIAAGVLAGLAPALRSTRIDLARAIALAVAASAGASRDGA